MSASDLREWRLHAGLCAPRCEEAGWESSRRLRLCKLGSVHGDQSQSGGIRCCAVSRAPSSDTAPSRAGDRCVLREAHAQPSRRGAAGRGDALQLVNAPPGCRRMTA